MRQRVLRVDQSPMNEKRWTLGLACGHDTWMTATRRPTRKTAECETCSDVEAMPRVLYYSAEWCRPCVAFGPVVEAAAKAEGVIVEKIDVDVPAAEWAAAAQKIRTVPTLVWVGDRPGSQRLVGAVNEAALRAWFKAGVEDANR